jgi:hypothetical protein
MQKNQPEKPAAAQNHPKERSLPPKNDISKRGYSGAKAASAQKQKSTAQNTLFQSYSSAIWNSESVTRGIFHRSKILRKSTPNKASEKENRENGERNQESFLTEGASSFILPPAHEQK